MRRDFAIIGILFVIPLILFFPQTLGGQTLLPAENLYQFEPYATYREVVQAPEIPHNALLSDLVLQNMQWKAFIRDNITEGEIPLWNPHQFSGIPFMAAGQQSTLYPLSIIYYVMPLSSAYGWFTVINLWLAGVFMLLLMRGFGVSRFGGMISGVTYQLAGMFVASAVHPMIIGTVVWMPLLLLMAEYIIRKRSLLGRETVIPWIAIGAVGLAFAILAGHVEITIYTLLILAFYSGLRLILQWWQDRQQDGALRHMLFSGVSLAMMVLIGLFMAGVQLIPLYEFVNTNWRAERGDLDTVLSYAHPVRDALQFIMPNVYGSPAQHEYLDIFTMQTVPVDFVNSEGARITNTEWGIKNYVEAALYLGILPLILSVLSIFSKRKPDSPPYRWIFLSLVLFSLTFMFGMRTYALIYVLPGINQLNTAFRWIFGVTVGVAILAGFGADAIQNNRKLAFWTGLITTAIGGLTLLVLLASRIFYTSFEPLIERVMLSMAQAPQRFETPAMFYSMQFPNVLIFGAVTLLIGLVILGLSREYQPQSRIPQILKMSAIAVLAMDLMLASWGFNPASDPALLDFTPPVVEWLQEQEGDWRYTVINSEGEREILRSNVTMQYSLDDIRGYDSIISKQYVHYMGETYPQNQLQYNRIAPLYTWDDYNAIVASERFNRLNIRYIVTHKSLEFSGDLVQDVTLVYEDEAVRVWENALAYPRAYTLDNPDDVNSFAVLDITPSQHQQLTSREKSIDVQIDVPTWLIVSETYAPGWKAFIRPQGSGEDSEQELSVELVMENFQGVYLPESGAWSVRLIYSPTSFQVGAFATIISFAVMLLMLGMWAWRSFVVRDDESTDSTQRLARNSVAPILLNLFNRGIDFVFAAVMFRILGPESAGFYYYAIVVFGWFDIFTNFGLDIYLMREAGRQRDEAGYLFFNTSILRLILVVSAIPLLMGFLFIRQSAQDPLNAEVLLTIGLFYVGLFPGSLSKGLTSLFYAFERAEYPAAVTTITTVSRVILGLAVLLIGYGIVGLAAVSIVTNVVTLAVLLIGGWRFVRSTQRRVSVDGNLMRGMIGESWPLMINHFLATIFFQIDIVLLEWIKSARIVGLYRVAYSWLLAINIIPAFFTQALFPIMSRQAQDDREALKRTYTLGIKILVSIAFPLAVLFSYLAEPLTWILGGASYLPEGAIALQIMIWSIPIGWMNSLTQYTLIAVDLQRRVTIAFAIAVTFNIVTNLVFIPMYSFQAAAVTTILSEMVLLIPFAVLLQSAIGRLNWLNMIWRSAVAAGVMMLVMAVLWSVHALVAVTIGVIIYPILLLALRPLNQRELNMLAPILPGRIKHVLKLI